MQPQVESTADRLIEDIARLLPSFKPDEVMNLSVARDVDSFHPDVHEKAYWCYQISAKMQGLNLMEKPVFKSG